MSSRPGKKRTKRTKVSRSGEFERDAIWVYKALKEMLGGDHFYAMPGKVQGLLGDLENARNLLQNWVENEGWQGGKLPWDVVLGKSRNLVEELDARYFIRLKSKNREAAQRKASPVPDRPVPAKGTRGKR